MRVGWLEDQNQGRFGGAELHSRALQAAAPADAEILPCPPAGGWAEDIDVFVVMRAWDYEMKAARLLEARAKPILVRLVDFWQESRDKTWRSWILSHGTRLVFHGPLHRDKFGHPWKCDDVVLLPSPVDRAAFEQAGLESQQREGLCWAGRIEKAKGVTRAMRWAAEQRRLVTFYGTGNLRPTPHAYAQFAGYVPYDQMPRALASHEGFVFMPDVPEAFGRAVVEASFAGCNLHLGGAPIGSTYWLERDPDAIASAASRFWEQVREVAGC